MADRESFLSKLGGILGRRMPDHVDHAGLLDDLGDLRPPLAAGDIVESFVAKATSERLTATTEFLGDLAGLPKAVESYRQSRNIMEVPVISPDPRLLDLPWGEGSFKTEITPDSALAVTVADYGIAETGSLVFTSTPDRPTLFNFLPLHHLVVLEKGRIVPYLDDYWRTAGPPAVRSVNFVTGTSGTADIEGRNVRGAHGPRFLHIVLVEGAVTGER